jgi:hypothetical protein
MSDLIKGYSSDYGKRGLKVAETIKEYVAVLHDLRSTILRFQFLQRVLTWSQHLLATPNMRQSLASKPIAN